jgi:diguanylate cyclase (GGDEF)-like protein
MATLLLIDDPRCERREIREALEGCAAFGSVLEVNDALGGLRALLSGGVDAVLCDLELRGAEGERLLYAKTGGRGESDIPFVFVGAPDSERKMRLLRDGASDVIERPFETGDLLGRMELHLRIKRLQRQLRERNADLERLSRTDPLTGLRTRRFVGEVLPLELARAFRYRMPLSVWVADLEGLDRINDHHGYAEGDEVLRGFGEIVRASLRATDVAARWGGHEFVMVLPHTDREGSVAAAERVRSVLERTAFQTRRSESLHATVAIGVASLERGIESADELLETARGALVEAREGGGNLVVAAPA